MDMIIGGKGRKDVEGYYGQLSAFPIQGDCSSFADAPIVSENAIGLVNANGEALLCGGSKNPGQKSCYVYDISSNSWSQGPSLKRKRVGASATCLTGGGCWVFGGKWYAISEYFLLLLILY